MPTLRAEQTLAAMNIASLPWMEDRARHQLLRSLQRDLGGDAGNAVKATADDLAGLGIPVVRVKANKSKQNEPEG